MKWWSREMYMEISYILAINQLEKRRPRWLRNDWDIRAAFRYVGRGEEVDAKKDSL